MHNQLEQYLPVLILLLVAVAFAAGNLLVSVVLGRWFGKRTKRISITKDTPYECGMRPEGEGSARMSVKFYLVAMLFILFDIEVVFLYPWAVVYKELGLFAFVEMMIFLGILALGLAYVWRKGDLEWVKVSVPYGRGRYRKLTILEETPTPPVPAPQETAA